jgi:hypothetical protein
MEGGSLHQAVRKSVVDIMPTLLGRNDYQRRNTWGNSTLGKKHLRKKCLGKKHLTNTLNQNIFFCQEEIFNRR